MPDPMFMLPGSEALLSEIGRVAAGIDRVKAAGLNPIGVLIGATIFQEDETGDIVYPIQVLGLPVLAYGAVGVVVGA